MKRAGIYARFSTDLQNDRSTEDQVALCRQFADREGLQVVEIFADKAKSGASTKGRPGLDALLKAAQDQKIDVIIVEALDRLSRDMEDLARIYKHTQHWGTEIRAVNEGVVNTVVVGLRGLLGQLYREDNVHKVRRGMSGLVRQGLHAGGRAYGYKPDPLNKGSLVIVPEEAEIVMRIFNEAAEGRSSREIVKRLNADHIPPPRGKTWNASSVHGSLDRGYGLLHNQLYIGKIVWNKVRMVKDPETGKRLSRANPPDRWEIHEVPELRIIPQELWDKVHGEERKPRGKLSANRRPKRILSGLLRCKACGSGMSVQGADKSGRSRLRCTGHVQKSICPEPATFYLDVIEQLVLDTLVKELETPDMIAKYLGEYHAERERLNRDLEKRRSSMARRIKTLENIAGEIFTRSDEMFEMAKPKLMAMEQEYRQLKADFEKLPPPAKIVALHKQTLKVYEAQLRYLRDAINQGIADGNFPASHALRDIVDHVTVWRDKETGKPKVRIQGKLNALLEAPSEGLAVMAKTGADVMVAGGGLEPPT